MAHSKTHPICSRVVNLTERPLNVYTNSGDIVTLEPTGDDCTFRAGTYFIVDIDTYYEAKNSGKDTKYLAGASPEAMGRDNKMIVSICRLDDFVRIYPME